MTCAGLWAPPASAWAQVTPARAAPALCRAPDALTLFTNTVRQFLRTRRVDGWTVAQLPCDTLPVLADSPARLLLIVDRASASDQDVLQYGFSPLPFGDATANRVALRPDDPFARIGRLIARPPLTAVPSIWIRGALDAGQADAVSMALAGGALQSVAGFTNPLCSPDETRVTEALLTAAVDAARNHPELRLYLEAALLERQRIGGQGVSITAAAQAVAADLASGVVPGLRCDVGKRERFSLMPFGPGTSSLALTADHLRHALASVRAGERSDLGHVNLARVCALDAVRDLLRRQRAPSCRADDYGLWTSAYAPLLHAAQVKVLVSSR